MAEITLEIEGMSCKHCVMRVKKAIDGALQMFPRDPQELFMMIQRLTGLP